MRFRSEVNRLITSVQWDIPHTNVNKGNDNDFGFKLVINELMIPFESLVEKCKSVYVSFRFGNIIRVSDDVTEFDVSYDITYSITRDGEICPQWEICINHACDHISHVQIQSPKFIVSDIDDRLITDVRNTKWFVDFEILPNHGVHKKYYLDSFQQSSNSSSEDEHKEKS